MNKSNDPFEKKIKISSIKNSIEFCERHREYLETLTNIYDVNLSSSNNNIGLFIRGFYLGKYGTKQYQEDMLFTVEKEREFRLTFTITNSFEFLQSYYLSSRYIRVDPGYYTWISEVSTTIPETDWHIVSTSKDPYIRVYKGSRSPECLVENWFSELNN